MLQAHEGKRLRSQVELSDLAAAAAGIWWIDRSVDTIIMATSNKPSVRSRAMAPSRAPPPVANGKSGYDAYHDEQLAAFENDDFDPKGYVESKCQSLSEKVWCFLSFFFPLVGHCAMIGIGWAWSLRLS